MKRSRLLVVTLGVLALGAGLIVAPPVAAPMGKGKPSCADAKRIRIVRCSPFVISDNMPGNSYNTASGRSTATSNEVTLVDQDEADAFVVPQVENVLLGSLDLALSYNSGSNKLDVYLVEEKTRQADYTSEPYAPDDTKVLEHWYLDGVVTAGSVIHLDSVLHPKLLAGVRYWVYISATEPVAIIVWNLGSLDYDGTAVFAERNYAYPDWTTRATTSTSSAPALRVTALH